MSTTGDPPPGDLGPTTGDPAVPPKPTTPGGKGEVEEIFERFVLRLRIRAPEAVLHDPQVQSLRKDFYRLNLKTLRAIDAVGRKGS